MSVESLLENLKFEENKGQTSFIINWNTFEMNLLDKFLEFITEDNGSVTISLEIDSNIVLAGLVVEMLHPGWDTSRHNSLQNGSKYQIARRCKNLQDGL